MREYERKIKRTVILFLGICALVINVATYFIITNSMDAKFMELAQRHIEHQYENCQRNMAVIEQQITSFCSNAQFIAAVDSKDLETVEKRLKDYYKSIQGAHAMAVFTLEDSGIEYLAGQGKIQYEDREFAVMTEHAIFDETNQNWYIQQQKSEKSIGFFCPLANDKQVGCVFTTFKIDNFMPEINNNEQDAFWEEHLAIVSEEIVWNDDQNYWEELDISMWDGQYDRSNSKQIFISSREITQTGAKLIQVINLKMKKEYGKIAIGLALLFMACMIVIYISVNKLIGNIIAVMIDLKEKMVQIQIH